MATVRKTVVYRVHGVEFATLDDLARYAEERLGAGIGLSSPTLTPKQRLDIYTHMMDNKAVFACMFETLINVERMREEEQRLSAGSVEPFL